MSFTFYSDRVDGPKPQVEEGISENVWAGFVALVERGLSSSLFAEDFPRECEDGNGVYACDRGAFYTTLKAEIPDLEFPLLPRTVPETFAVLDMLEFLCRSASKAENENRHAFYGHYHLRFDRQAGRLQLREDVNRILTRNGSAYYLDDDGRVKRVVSDVLQEQLRNPFPPSRDKQLDAIIDSAVNRISKPDPAERQVALKELWDAFERSKTVLNQKKTKGVKQLLESVTDSAVERELLEQEMKTLTNVGNSFQIRHHETGTHEVGTAMVDYLFTRLFALMSRLHEALR